MAIQRATIAGLVVALWAPLAYHLAVGPLLLEPRLDIEVRALLGYSIMWVLAAAVIGLTVA